MSKPIDLSLILTLYNEGSILPSTLNRISSLLDKTKLSYEIILIDDCSQDQTVSLAKKAIRGRENCRFYQHKKNVGRGGTVSKGIKLAKGKVVGFIDTDLEIAPDKIPEAVKMIMDNQADVVTGLRVYKLRFSSLLRYFLTKSYHYLVKCLLSLPLLDTETGFKFFNREKILPVLAQVEDKRWFWDTEIMALSYQANLKIKEIPVQLRRRPEKKSSVKIFQDSLEYFKKLIRFRRRLKKSMKAFKELGLKKLLKFFFVVPLMGIFNFLGYPNLRVIFLKIFGSQIGKNVVIHKIKLFNLYAGKFSNLLVGNNAFIGDGSLLDMANKIKLGNHVTLAERVVVLTHTNVGYKDHPLQKYFPRLSAPVEFKNGCFIGANSTILPGTVIGKQSFVAAGSVVNKSVPPRTLVAGVPAKIIRRINEDDKRKRSD